MAYEFYIVQLCHYKKHKICIQPPTVHLTLSDSGVFLVAAVAEEIYHPSLFRLSHFPLDICMEEIDKKCNPYQYPIPIYHMNAGR